MPRIGETILHYRLIQKLGEGGMGEVFKAEDTRLKRTVALKFLPRELEASEADRARFLQEAQAASALNHPNVCTIYDLKEDAGRWFIVMEYVDGPTLRALVTGADSGDDGDKSAPVKPLAVPVALTHVVSIAGALHEAHLHGIVHRDVKPENLMLNARGQIKVMDFGIAKLKGSQRLTKTSSTVGTVRYMSPEQIAGGDVDGRSDIFSLGIVLFELLAGRTPFAGDHDAAVMYSIAHENPERIENYRGDLPGGLGAILQRALEKKPADRYQGCDEMVEAIASLSAPGGRRTSRKSSGTTLVTAALLSAIGLALVFLRPWEDPLPSSDQPPGRPRPEIIYLAELTTDPEYIPAVTTEYFAPGFRRLPLDDSIRSALSGDLFSRLVTGMYPEPVIGPGEIRKSLLRDGIVDLPGPDSTEFYGGALACRVALWPHLYRLDPPEDDKAFVTGLTAFFYSWDDDSSLSRSGLGGFDRTFADLAEFPGIMDEMLNKAVAFRRHEGFEYRIESFQSDSLLFSFSPDERPRPGMLLEVGRSFIPAEKSYRARLDRIERAIGYCSMHAEWAGELPRLRREHDETAGEYRTWKANQRGDVDYSDVGITVVVLEVSDTTASGVVRKRDYPWLEIIEGDYLTF